MANEWTKGDVFRVMKAAPANADGSVPMADVRESFNISRGVKAKQFDLFLNALVEEGRCRKVGGKYFT